MIVKLTTALAAAAASLLVAAAPGHAADWRRPYQNIDPRVDQGGDTGDSQVERLNEGQLDANYRGPWHYMNGQPAPRPGAFYVPPPGAYPPSPGVYAPPGAAYAPPPPDPYAPPR